MRIYEEIWETTVTFAHFYLPFTKKKCDIQKPQKCHLWAVVSLRMCCDQTTWAANCFQKNTTVNEIQEKHRQKLSHDAAVPVSAPEGILLT